MGIIQARRTSDGHGPAHIAAMNWMVKTLDSIRNDSSKSEEEKNLAEYRFSNVKVDEIWIENAIPSTEHVGKYLLCFSLPLRGFAVLDAVVDPVTFNDVLRFFGIPVKIFDTYESLFDHIKVNSSFNQVVRVTESQDDRYGVVDNVKRTREERHQSISTALKGVLLDFNLTYSDTNLELITPVVGVLSLSRGTFKTTLLEVYPVNEVIKM